MEGGKVSRWLGTISTRRECLASLFFFQTLLIAPFQQRSLLLPVFFADLWPFYFPINTLKLEILLLIFSLRETVSEHACLDT